MKKYTPVKYTPNMPFQWQGPPVQSYAGEEWKDTGCRHRGVQISTSCLDCPLQECKLDNVKWADLFIRKTLVLPEGEGSAWIKAYAAAHHVTMRTVYRYLKNGRDTEPS